MRRWFISYRLPDEALAKALKAAVERKDKNARVLLGRAELRAGGFGLRALADEIAKADGFILLAGQAGFGNRQALEYYLALDRHANSGFPLVLVLPEGRKAPSLPFLRECCHWIVTPDPASEKDVEHLIEALAGQGSKPEEEGTSPSSLLHFTSSFRGLLEQTIAREGKAKAQARRAQALAFAGLIIILGLVGVINQSSLAAQWHWWTLERPYMLAEFRPHVLGADAERALKPGQSFKECAKDCPEMVVVPAGAFLMGSPPNEPGRFDNEGPQHRVTIARRFALGKFDVTFDEWDACVRFGGCPDVSDGGWGRGRQPVINVSWEEAQDYVAWLSKMTAKTYRLVYELEWEYAARAGTTTAAYWGDAIGKNNAACIGCGSKWDDLQPAPVGSFKPNQFGLYDMAGNLWQWTQDCYHDNYDGAPTDGSAWATPPACKYRVTRGGSWCDTPSLFRSAARTRITTVNRYDFLGFRVARTLSP